MGTETGRSYPQQAVQILERISDAFFSVDSQWRLTYVNKSTERLWRMPREELLGMDLWGLFAEYRQLRSSQELYRAMAERVPVSYETYSPFLQTYLETDAYPDEDGGLSVYFRDISGRKPREEEQTTNEYMLRLAIDATGIGFWYWDIATGEGGTIYASPKVPSEWHQQSIERTLSGIHPEDRERVREGLRAAERGEARYMVEYRRVLPSGDVVWLYSQGEVLKDGDGRPTQMIGVNYDITYRKKLEAQERISREAEERRRHEQEFLEVLDGSSEGSWVVDIVRRTKLISGRWKERLGLAHADEFEQYRLDVEAIHPDDMGQVLQGYYDCMGRQDPKMNIEYRTMTASGEYIWVQSRGKIIYDDDGRPLKIYGTTIDITDRKNMELQLLEKNRLIVDFFTNISHEFKTPLSIILLDLDLMTIHLQQAHCQYRDKIDHNVAIMRQNAYRLLRLIVNLLDVTKIDAGFMKARLSSTDIAALLRGLVESVGDYASSKGITVRFIERCGIMHMPADGEKLERIMLNLLSNAIKHTPRGGHVTVRLRAWPDRVRISVRDDGEGIPADKHDIIFDRFRQVTSSLTRNSEGCGIGLSLTKALVELLQGKIWFVSKPGRGAEFFVELPVLEEEGAALTVTDGLTMSRKVEMEFSDIIM